MLRARVQQGNGLPFALEEPGQEFYMLRCGGQLGAGAVGGWLWMPHGNGAAGSWTWMPDGRWLAEAARGRVWRCAAQVRSIVWVGRSGCEVVLGGGWVEAGRGGPGGVLPRAGQEGTGSAPAMRMCPSRSPHSAAPPTPSCTTRTPCAPRVPQVPACLVPANPLTHVQQAREAARDAAGD